ncbi:MAG TPA: hypothetical protein VMI53_06130 [Opitutaceae bacterium]|nr:hypothetical protein [Opitutaceae bacterium]
MNLRTFIVAYVPTALVAGVLGVAALELVMWLITRKGWARGNMLIAIGSLVTRSRDRAFLVGALFHVGSGVFFALLYAWVMWRLGLTHLQNALAAGAGFGALQGMMVSLTLVWIVAEHHPLEEFKEAGLAIGVSHVAGHVAFGVMVGLVVGLSPL